MNKEKNNIIEKMLLINNEQIKIEKHQVILRKNKNECLESIYLLISGEALLEAYEASETFMYIVASNEIFGMENLIMKENSFSSQLEYTVTALSNCTYIKLNAQFF